MSITMDELAEIFERTNVAEIKSRGGVAAFAKYFETDLIHGLEQSERDNNYAERKAKYGVNVLPNPPQTTWCEFFLESFKDLMLQILLACVVISVVLVSIWPEDENNRIESYIEPFSILVAVILVSCVGAQINYLQQKSFLEINTLKNVYNINVIRCGEETQILSTELLVGDILSLKNGDRVAADALYISGHDLTINNSQETGESDAVKVNDDHPIILGNGAVQTGDAHALVVAVGPNTQGGLLMMKLQEIEEEAELSPLQKKLEYTAKLLTYIGAAGAIITFIILFIFWIIDISTRDYDKDTDTNALIKHFMVGVTIFICAVPEGLPLAVTLSLGFSMKKMMTDNNFVRHLNACETMGGATTICSDKTGTLTQNKMTVVKFYQVHQVQDDDPKMIPPVLELFTHCISLNSSAYYAVKEGETQGSFVGPSSECALLQMLPKFNVNYKDIRDQYPIKVLHEFNSERKRMSTIVAKNDNAGHRLYSKGAPDVMLRFTTHYLDTQGEVHELTDQVRGQILETVTNFADQSLRTLLLAFRDFESPVVQNEWSAAENVENNLIIIALVGIKDPLRPEVIKAIANCHRGGVIVRMVTGDFINTAKAIATECGIIKNENDIAIEGREFATKSKLDLIDIAPRLRVMARSSPRDKYRLVSYLMEAGEVVAVTGDGSNDSAALKKANVGLAMGECGTELAKMASDIIILDDNFNSIVAALKWGRCVYDNVRGFLQFQLTVNMVAMLVAIIGSIKLKTSPLKTIQLLWVNLIMDSLGALALATRGPSDALLNRPPYGESDGLISPVLFRNILGHTLYQIAVLLLLLFLPDGTLFLTEVPEHRSSVVFNAFIFMEVFNLINARIAGQDMSIFDGLFSNPFFWIIFFVIAIFQVVIMVTPVRQPFELVDINWQLWLITVAFGAGSLIIGFILRLIPVPDNTTRKLEALREYKKEEMRTKYSGMSFDDQWNYQPVQSTESATEEVSIKP